MEDFKLNSPLKKGKRGQKVRYVQGLLSLSGFHIAVDGIFGPATEFAVKQYQEQEGLTVNGIIGSETYETLITPLLRATREIDSNGKTLNEMVVAYAEQHLAEHPREVGGQNMGPWVRLYMNRNEGPPWLWCAGFVSFILKQACKSLDVPLPVGTSFSCDTLAHNAKAKGIFLSETDVKNGATVTPGSIFLNRRTSTDWVHTGLVIGVEDEFFHTIEGNTNDDGLREGYEVCKRIRGFKKKDFINY